MTETPTIYYSHDPMCSWCWGFAPSWQLLKKALHDTYGDSLNVVSLLGGLAPDSDEPMPESMRRYLRETWVEIGKKIPGTRFNFEFWHVCEPKRSTWPACRAVIAARRQRPHFEDVMIRAIQKAYYMDARNPSNPATLVAIAEEIGIDRNQFREDIESDSVNAEHKKEMLLVRQLGVQGFPSLVIVINRVAHRVLLDYSSLDKTLEHIDRLMQSVSQAPLPAAATV